MMKVSQNGAINLNLRVMLATAAIDYADCCAAYAFDPKCDGAFDAMMDAEEKMFDLINEARDAMLDLVQLEIERDEFFSFFEELPC